MSQTMSGRVDGPRSWLVALVSAVAMAFTFGNAFSYGVFIGPFSDSFAISPLFLGVVFGVMLFTFFIGAGLVAIFAVQVPPRSMLLSCAGVTALLAPSLYLVQHPFGLLVIFAILGLPLGTVFVVTAAVVPNWFEQRRGIATGVIFTGNGLGLFLLPPMWQLAIDRVGIPRAFLLVLAVSAISFFLAGTVCRQPEWLDTRGVPAVEMRRWTRRTLSTGASMSLFIGVGFTFAWFQLLTAYAIDMFTRFGLSPTQAAFAFGSIGGVSIVSRLAAGFVADRVGFRSTFIAALVSSFAGLSLFLIPANASLAGAIVLTGIGLGGTATLYVPLLIESFEATRSIPVVGLSNVFIGIFALAAPLVGIALVAVADSFWPAIVLTMGTTAGAIVTIFLGTR